MTVSTESNREEFECNGVTTEFEFPNYFLADEDLVVLLVTVADGTETTLALGTDYTVTGAGNSAGGTITTTSTYADTYELVVYRDPRITQGLDLVENDPLPAEELEKAYDRLTMLDQRDRELVSRALRLPEGDTGFTAGQLLLPAKVLRANKLLGFDGDGAPMAAVVTDTVLPTTASTYIKRNAGNTAYDAKTPGEVLTDLQAARHDDLFADWVISGLLPATSASLTSDISAGSAYVTGRRLTIPLTSHTYTASVDTYVDIDNTGTYLFSEVATGGVASAQPANSIRLAKVVTDATAVTSVVDLRETVPISKAHPARYQLFPVTHRSVQGGVYPSTNPQAIYDAIADRTFFVYPGPGREPYITAYDHAGLYWLDPVRIGTNPLETAPNTGINDDHGCPCLAIDKDGFIHVLWGSHNSAVSYAKGSAARDIGAWTVSSLTHISAMTYPSMTLEPTSGDIYAFFRAGSAHGATYPAHEYGGLMRLPAGGAALDWVEVAGGIIDLTGYPGAATDAYVTDCEAYNGKIYVAWHAADGAAHDDVHKDPSVAYYNPADGNMYSVGGTLIGSTVTFADLASVRIAAADYVWGPSIAIDEATGKIYATWLEAISIAEGSGHFVATWDGTAWTTVDTGARQNQAGGCGYVNLKSNGTLELIVTAGGRPAATPFVTSATAEYANVGWDVEAWTSSDGTTWSLANTVARVEHLEAQGGRTVTVPKNAHDGLVCLFGVWSTDSADYTLPIYAVSAAEYEPMRVADMLTKVPSEKLLYNTPTAGSYFLDDSTPPTTYEIVDVSDYVPDNAIAILLEAVLTPAAAGAGTLDFRHPRASNREGDVLEQFYHPSTDVIVRQYRVPVSYDRQIEYTQTGHSRVRFQVNGFVTK